MQRLSRLSSVEEYYSAYSEAAASSDDDASSEDGYETAAAGVVGRLSPSPPPPPTAAVDVEAPSAEVRSPPSAVDPSCESAAHFPQVARIISTLNDCIWCTNAFTAGRLKGRTSDGFFASRKPAHYLYPDEDIKKELEYIEFLLHALLKLLLPVHDKEDSGHSDVTAKDLLLKTSALLDGWPSDLHSVAPPEVPCSGDDGARPEEPLKPPQRRPGLDERHMTAMLRAISAEVEAAGRGGVDEGPRWKRAAEALRSLRSLLQGPSSEEEGQRSLPTDHALLRIGHAFEWNAELSRLAARVNCESRLADFFVGLVCESPSPSAAGDSGRGASSPRGWCWSAPPDDLLFERERWRVWAVHQGGGDPSEHLGGIALPLDYGSFKSDTRATYYGIKRKNMLSIALQTADMSEKIHKGLPKKIFDLAMLLLSITLYLSDLVSDLILAGDHYSQGNRGYSYLTLVFVFAPFISETLSKFILKSLGWDKEYGQLQWRDVFNFNDFKIIKWMACSVNYSVRSMIDYRPLAPSYAELHAHRRSKGRKEVPCNEGEEEGEEHIHRIFYSLLAWNERFTLQTKLAESLSESAPQLLLQLVIVLRQLASRSTIGFKTWFCLVTSTLSLSWSMHLSHFNRHYQSGGRVLNNSYKWKARIMEFVGNCFVYGSRLLSIALVISVFGAWFVLGALLYLTAVYLVMILASGRKEIYRTLHRYKTTIFWPLHRLFTVPYRIGVWRMDSLDHLLYYSEVVALALLPPFFPSPGADPWAAWITASVLLSLAGAGVALLFAFKKCAHPYGYVCENR